MTSGHAFQTHQIRIARPCTIHKQCGRSTSIFNYLEFCGSVLSLMEQLSSYVDGFPSRL